MCFGDVARARGIDCRAGSSASPVIDIQQAATKGHRGLRTFTPARPEQFAVVGIEALNATRVVDQLLLATDL